MSDGVSACGGRVDRFKAFCRDPETRKFAQRTAVVVVALAAILVVTGLITAVSTDCYVQESFSFPIYYPCLWCAISLIAATVGLIMLKRKLKGQQEGAAEEPKSKSLWGSEELSESSSGRSAAVGVGFKRARIIAMIASLAVVAIGASVILWSCAIHDLNSTFRMSSGATARFNQIISDMKIAGSSILISGAIAFAASFFAATILKKLGVSCIERRLAKEISEGGFGNRSHQVDEEQDL